MDFKFFTTESIKKQNLLSVISIKTNIFQILEKNVHVFIAYSLKVCYITNVIILNIITRIYSVIWSERFYLVPNERTRLRVKVFGRSVY